MKKIITPQYKIELAYEKRNEQIVDDFIAKKLTVRETIKELNKNLGHTLVALTEIK